MLYEVITKEGTLSVENITEEMFSDNLDTKGIPDPDLLIRTSAEQRISNFMLWQLSYTELYFPEVLWPDFSKKDLEDAIAYYNKRERSVITSYSIHYTKLYENPCRNNMDQLL